MKIKKFRIKPRLSSVERILKSLLSVKQLTPDVQELLAAESQAYPRRIIPVAFYNTWSHHEIPVEFEEIVGAAGLTKAVSISALVSTIGASAEEYLTDSLMKGETLRSQIVTALNEDAADGSMNFLIRLLEDEAKGDDCELSEALPVYQEPLLSQTLALLESEQEGIYVDQASHLTPRFTRVALAAWLPISKRKRPSALPKKKTA